MTIKHVLALVMILTFAATTPAWAETYMCPMHPHVTDTREGKCPICGMDLVALEEEDHSGHDHGAMQSAPADPHAGHGSGAEASKGGMGSTRISPQAQQSIGVRTAEVSHFNFGRSIRGFGNVVSNPAAEVAIVPRVSGWVKTMTVFTEGEPVKADQELFTLYSPDLISAQKDYLAARTSGNKVRTFASKERLRLMGFDQQAIAKLERSGKAFDNVPFHAPTQGTVLNVHVREGSYIMAGKPVMMLADYSTLWVEAEIAEQDIAFLKEGDWASLEFSNGNLDPMTGRIELIYPTIDPTTRTGKVRIVINNNDGAIRAGSYADIVFVNDSESRLAVPSETILYDSMGARAVMVMPDGQYMAQMVKTGITADGMTEIKEGLKHGDLVVISGQFLIDADVRIKSNISGGGGAHANH